MPYKDLEAKRAHDRAYKKAWRQAHAAQKRAETRAWRQANPERTRALNRAQKLRDRAKIQQRAKARYHSLRETNPALFEARAEQARIRSRAHYYANRAAKIAYQQTYAQLHADMILPRQRAYYETHKDALALANKAYRQAHPEVERTRRKRRDASKASASIIDLTHAQWLEIQAAQDHRCAYCGKRCKDTLTQDHITPVGPEGPHTLHNIVGACVSCNSRKQRKPPPVPVQPLLLTIAPARKPRKKD
jgi:5-methylcytosine-specific restriction endonuclease McrA